MAFLNALPGAIAEGLIWGLMAIGVYISYKVLDIADLTVDGSICTGACVCAMLIAGGCPVLLAVLLAFLAGVVTGIVTGLLHTIFGISVIVPGFFIYKMLITAVQTTYRREYTKLHPSARKFCISYAKHMSADIVAPPSVARIGSCGREIRLEVQGFPCNESIT